MITRFLQLTAFALIAAPLLIGIVNFNQFKALQESGSLSIRAKEFIATQQETGKSMWNEVSLQTPPPTTAVLGTQQYRVPCFAVTIPWPHVLEPRAETDESCSIKLKLTALRARLVIHATSTTTPLTQQTAVVIRYAQPEQFTPVQAPETQWPEAIQFVEPDTATLFLASPTWTISFAATGLTNPEGFSFEPLLSSLEMMP